MRRIEQVIEHDAETMTFLKRRLLHFSLRVFGFRPHQLSL